MTDHNPKPRPTNASDSNTDSSRLEAGIIRALETPPQFSIPNDFAARVARQLPPLQLPAITPARHGRNAAIVSMLVVLILIFAFAQRGTGTSHFWLSMELIYCAQLVLLAVWLGTRHARPFS
jgi:hypothetical protein